ncbi:MAG: alcohol dehydrogenase [Acidimicrobiales bacterium]|nr:MAG: alcohol dehydrogenase [Acidimicrobiales bacterium]
MRALLFGTTPAPATSPPRAGALEVALASTPMDLVDLPEPSFLRPDWVVIRPRLTGICGSDAKQVFMDWGDMSADNPMIDFTSFPHVLGHEVVADVVALGPEASGVEIGDRVVLDPWLGCVPRGIAEPCPACVAGDNALCWNFRVGPIAPGIHSGTSADASGGFAELMPAHSSMLHPVPDSVSDEHAVLADPFAVSLHSVTRHPPPDDGRVIVYGAGALGSSAIVALRTLFPSVEIGVVARFDAQADLARRLGAHRVFAHEPLGPLIEDIAHWSGGVLHGDHDLPMAHPGGVDVVYDTISRRDSLEVASRVLRSRGTIVKSGVHGHTAWEWTPLYFKELAWVGSNAFGVEVVDGERAHGIDHYLRLTAEGRVDLRPMLTHTRPLEQWRDAFSLLADQAASGAVKVAFDQR